MYKVYIYSSRSGGPYNQHQILCKSLLDRGYNVVHWSGLLKWILLHFNYGKNIKILTNVPFIFRFKNSGFYLNIHGNYNLEKSFKNPLGYLYKYNTYLAEKIILPNKYLKKELNLKDAIVVNNYVKEINYISVLKDMAIIKLVTVTNFSFLRKAEGVIKIIKSLSLLNVKENIVFDIFGSGYFFEKIKEKSKKIMLPVNIKIVFRGYSNNIVKELLRSDIFVYWSELDTWGMCLSEAMACRLPIVINNYLPFKEWIYRKNLFSINEKDFSDNLYKLILDKEYRRRVGMDNRLFYEKLLKNNKKNTNNWIKILGIDSTGRCCGK